MPRKARRHKTDHLWNLYREGQKEFKNLINTSKHSSWKNFASKISDIPSTTHLHKALNILITINLVAPSLAPSKNKLILYLLPQWNHQYIGRCTPSQRWTTSVVPSPPMKLIQTMKLLSIILWHHWDFKKHVKAWHQINHLVQIMSDSQWLMQHMRIFHRNRAPFSVTLKVEMFRNLMNLCKARCLIVYA